VTLSAGTKLGRYEIRSKIGEGGMGEVYRAVDTELDRPVAIKVLPENLASDQQRLQRFIQEAKAASALNHPHILTIYEIGSLGNTRFMASEFIDGDTLREHMRAPRKLTEILEIAIQTASALATAHAAGIIHRDIKPENIMVRRDGYVKVLDFGLAKLTEAPTATSDPEAATRAMVNTGAGMVMGTANYMSPEQAKGTQVDARSDIWSLGAVLYEMVAGRVPFPGETPTETISLIMLKEPAPVTRFAPDIPPELERIVTKALTKDREERYQTMKDLLIDLRALKRRLEVDAEIDRTVAPELRGASTSSNIRRAVSASAVSVPPTAAASGISSAEYIATGIKRHKLIVAPAIVVIVVGAVFGWWYWHARSSEVAIDSIAVLPFANQSGNPNDEWLADGVTESIINSLTQLPNLRVIARSSVFRYKAKETDPFVAGKDLGVRAVLVGRMMQRGDIVSVSTELIDIRENKQLWGEQYDEKVSELISLPRDIASKITSNLRLTISGEDRNRMMKHDTDNAEAYQLYLKGRYYWNKRGTESLKQAAQFYNQAIEKDPSYALAYAGLAETYSLYPDYSVASPADCYPKSKAAADRALQLDSSLAEPHTALGRYYNYWEWNRTEAEREYRRAIELKPNYATAHHWLGTDILTQLKRFDEGIVEGKRAQELDPLSAIIATNLGDAYMFARRYDEALAQYKHALTIDPNFYFTHTEIGTTLASKGNYQDAIAEMRKGVELSGGDPLEKGYLAFVLGKAGQRAEAQKLLDEIKHDASGGAYVPPYAFALAYLGLGQKDEAFTWLSKNADAHDSTSAFAAVDALLDDLRSDPRFPDLLKRVGLTPRDVIN
jgi:eukaryotic-like serine/threonine-protein kinase